jgi:hypothetical protein
VAIAHARLSVGTTPVKLTGTTGDRRAGQAALVQNPSGSAAPVFLGAEDVTTSDYGHELVAGSSLPIDLGDGEELYGVVATGTVTVNVLRGGA